MNRAVPDGGREVDDVLLGQELGELGLDRLQFAPLVDVEISTTSTEPSASLARIIMPGAGGELDDEIGLFSISPSAGDSLQAVEHLTRQQHRRRNE